MIVGEKIVEVTEASINREAAVEISGREGIYPWKYERKNPWKRKWKASVEVRVEASTEAVVEASLEKVEEHPYTCSSRLLLLLFTTMDVNIRNFEILVRAPMGPYICAQSGTLSL